jgi:peptidoglycan hydrolase-like protein with peptidoglycan-binding domain
VKITTRDLEAQYVRAVRDWPFIHDTEARFGLPRFLLFAVGSRETNLRDISGDGGHGRGVFQLDDRSHVIPSPFPVTLQASTAAVILDSDQDYFTKRGAPADPLRAAIAAYNCGRNGERQALESGKGYDGNTTGGDYSADVLERWNHLRIRFGTGAPLPPANTFTVRRYLRLRRVRYMRGSDVFWVQSRVRCAQDGVYGPATRAHVVDRQRQLGLSADGVVGPMTARALGGRWAP